MGTKNNPGNFDCYANAAPDEPMFILLARDLQAPELVELWAQRRLLYGTSHEKLQEALKCADDMRAWYVRNEMAKQRQVDEETAKEIASGIADFIQEQEEEK